jgi:HK97 family phage major capsid protein
MGAKRKLTDVEEKTFNDSTAEINNIDQTLVRMDAIAKGKIEVGRPQADVVIPVNDESVDPKKLSPEYRKAFWNALKNRNLNPQNAALGEGGTAGDGSYLVPIQTDPTIPALAIVECTARSLSLVTTTEMDIRLPYQSAKSVATAKAEANSNGTNAFGTSVPQFGTTTLTAYMGGNSLAVSWELLADSKAVQTFVTADLNRAVFVYEENAFIVGGSNGATSPLGYLEGAASANSAAGQRLV